MSRAKIIMIRLTESELRSLVAVADAEKLPVSTFVRRHMLLAIERQKSSPIQNPVGNGSEAVPTGLQSHPSTAQ